MDLLSGVAGPILFWTALWIVAFASAGTAFAAIVVYSVIKVVRFLKWLRRSSFFHTVRVGSPSLS